MQKMKLSVLLIAIGFLFSNHAYSQKNKIAHLNSQKIYQSMPELKTADETLNTFVKQYEDQLTKMNNEYTDKLTEFGNTQKEMNELIKNLKIEELDNLQKRIQQFKTTAQTSVEAKKNELYTPIIDKFNTAVKTVSKKNGYKLVIDNSQSAIIYHDTEDDITNLVLIELGIKP